MEKVIRKLGKNIEETLLKSDELKYLLDLCGKLRIQALHIAIEHNSHFKNVKKIQ